MNSLQQMSTDASVTASVVHLMVKDSPAELKAAEPERMQEEFRVRATQMSPILEGILHESHGHSLWGLNE